jgi:dTMP kinase
MAGQGKFIVLEGIDGSGKTSALARLEAVLRSEGWDVVATREPGGTTEGAALRQLLLARGAHDWLPMAELLLMTAARVQHVDKLIKPALARGAVVLCDRFVASTIAYQGGGRGIPAAEVLALHRLAVGDLRPDLTVLLDLDPPEALARSRGRLAAGTIDESRFEDLDLAFHERVRRSFLEQAAARPDAWRVIDAGRPQAVVVQEVVTAVRAALGLGGREAEP